jgi:hypothetical protein
LARGKIKTAGEKGLTFLEPAAKIFSPQETLAARITTNPKKGKKV